MLRAPEPPHSATPANHSRRSNGSQPHQKPFARGFWGDSLPAATEATKRKPKALVLALWLHGLAAFAGLMAGFIDYIPGTPGVVSESKHFERVFCLVKLRHII